MSKWQQIAKLTDTLNTGLNEIWDRKLKSDASVIVGDSWSNLMLDHSNFFNESQNYIDVGKDEKTGALSCLTKFPNRHPDFESNNKPYSQYILDSFDSRAKGMMENVKNPYAKTLLKNNIMNQRTSISGQKVFF